MCRAYPSIATLLGVGLSQYQLGSHVRLDRPTWLGLAERASNSSTPGHCTIRVKLVDRSPGRLHRSTVERRAGPAGHPQPKSDTHRRRERATRCGAGASGCDCEAPVHYFCGRQPSMRGSSAHCWLVALGRDRCPARESNQGNGTVEDYEKHQARRFRAQAPRARPQWHRPPAVAGNRRPTEAQCYATQCRPQQREPLRSTRPPLRLPHAFARLSRGFDGTGRR